MSEFIYVVKTMAQAVVDDGLGVVIVVALVVAVRFTVLKLSR